MGGKSSHDASIASAKSAAEAAIRQADAATRQAVALAQEKSRQVIEVARIQGAQAEKLAEYNLKRALAHNKIKGEKIQALVNVARICWRTVGVSVALGIMAPCVRAIFEMLSKYTKDFLKHHREMAQLKSTLVREERAHQLQVQALENDKYKEERAHQLQLLALENDKYKKERAHQLQLLALENDKYNAQLANPELAMLEMRLANRYKIVQCVMQPLLHAGSNAPPAAWQTVTNMIPDSQVRMLEDGTVKNLGMASVQKHDDSVLPEDSLSQHGQASHIASETPSDSMSHFSLISLGQAEKSKGRCFLEDALFLSPANTLVPARLLDVHSRIIAADGQKVTVMSKNSYPEEDMVELRTTFASIVVTGSHRVVVSEDGSTLPAADLKAGDYVVCSGYEEIPLEEVQSFRKTMTVVEMVLHPDKAVESFHIPGAAILSKGQVPGRSSEHWTPSHQHHPKTRRGGMCKRGRSQQQDGPGAEVISIPETHDSLR